jgi:hypothetical protein
MAIVRGQWYQWKALPDRFYRVNNVLPNGYVQMYPYDTVKYQYFYQTQAYILANFRLISYPVQYALLNGGGAGKVDITRSSIVHWPVISARLSTTSSVESAHCRVPTELLGMVRSVTRFKKAHLYLRTFATSGSVKAHSKTTKAGLVNPLALEGHLATQGRVVQAHCDQG